MIFYVISIINGINLDIDNFGIKCGDKVIINDAPILRPWTGDYPNYCTWLNWSENGICKIY